jgi:hypothetical protein
MTKLTRIRLAAAAGLTGALVPLAIFAGPGLAHGSASAAQYQYAKKTICHHAGSHGKTVTIRIAAAAWKAHQRHGDTEGACSATLTATAKTHGHSHPNGKAKGHGK